MMPCFGPIAPCNLALCEYLNRLDVGLGEGGWPETDRDESRRDGLLADADGVVTGDW